MAELKSVIVMRYPTLPEDEGRHHFITRLPSREAARGWIKAQKGKYFGPGDYYIAAEIPDEE